MTAKRNAEYIKGIPTRRLRTLVTMMKDNNMRPPVKDTVISDMSARTIQNVRHFIIHKCFAIRKSLNETYGYLPLTIGIAKYPPVNESSSFRAMLWIIC